MVRNEASMVQNEASMVRNEASMVRNEASMVRNEASMVRNEASMVRNEASMFEMKHRFVILSRRSDVGEAEVAEDGRRTPFLVTRAGRRYLNDASTWGVLRPSAAAPPFGYAAPAAQDDKPPTRRRRRPLRPRHPHLEPAHLGCERAG